MRKYDVVEVIDETIGSYRMTGQRVPHWNQRMPMPAKTTE
jgi:hypothetical protein